MKRTRKVNNLEKYEIPSILTDLEDDTLATSVAGILADLDSEAIPDITDRLKIVDDVQGNLSAVTMAIKGLIEQYNALSDDLARQKEANTKLMYERINRKEAEEKKEAENLEASIDEAVDDIDIYED